MAGEDPIPAQPVIDRSVIIQARQVVKSIYVDDKIKDYILDIVFATRDPVASGMRELSQYIEVGASPRATLSLARAAKANAFLRGRGFVTPDDVKQIVMDVLRHRIVTTFEADAESISAVNIIQQIVSRTQVP